MLDLERAQIDPVEASRVDVPFVRIDPPRLERMDPAVLAEIVFRDLAMKPVFAERIFTG